MSDSDEMRTMKELAGALLDRNREIDLLKERIAELEKGLRHIREAIEANEVGSKTALGIVVVSTVDALLPKEGAE